MNTRLKPFTLLEVLIVVGIIALLAGILLPVLKMAKTRSRHAACISNLKQLGIALNAYADTNNGRLPIAKRVGDTPADSGQISNILTVGDKKVYHCPADTAEIYEGKTYFHRYGSSYEWHSWANDRLIEKANFKIQAIKIPTPLLSDAEKFHTPLGKNFLYEDGSVSKLKEVSIDGSGN